MSLTNAELEQMDMTMDSADWVVADLIRDLKEARALLLDVTQVAGVHQEQGVLMCESCGASTVDMPLFTGTDADIDHDARCPYIAAIAYLEAAGVEVK